MVRPRNAHEPRWAWRTTGLLTSVLAEPVVTPFTDVDPDRLQDGYSATSIDSPTFPSNFSGSSFRGERDHHPVPGAGRNRATLASAVVPGGERSGHLRIEQLADPVPEPEYARIIRLRR